MTSQEDEKLVKVKHFQGIYLYFVKVFSRISVKSNKSISRIFLNIFHEEFYENNQKNVVKLVYLISRVFLT